MSLIFSSQAALCEILRIISFDVTVSHRWEDNTKMYLQEVGWGAWTGLIWLRIGTGGGLL
jgi:hypothetical protein